MEKDITGGGLIQPKNTPADRGLTASAFPHQADRFVFHDGERNVIYGPYVTDFLTQQTSSDWEVHFEIFYIDDGVILC